MVEKDEPVQGIPNNGFLWTVNSEVALSVGDSRKKSQSSSDAVSVESQSVEKDSESQELLEIEKSSTFLRQATLPFLMAGLGTVCAGLLLDTLQSWELFELMPEMNVIVTPLLGMKGNLEMTLGSRLATQTHLGKMETTKQKVKMLFTNMALNQTLAVYLSFLASLIAVSMAYMEGKETYETNATRFDVKLETGRALIMCATAITTGSLSSLLLDILMWTVVVVSRRVNINPDNVTTPFAGSLGDLASLCFLALFGTIFMKSQETAPWLCSAVVALYFLLIPVFIYYACKDKGTLGVFKQGLWPVIVAMCISTGAGRIFEISVGRFENTAIAAFQPIINGIGGNLVSVQASRLGTSLHKTSTFGKLPSSSSLLSYISLKRAYFSKEIDSKTARILLLMVIPGQLIFFFAIFFIKNCDIGDIPVFFVFAYLAVAMLQVFFLLFVCQLLVRLMWRLKIDPDSSTIPLLTALGDLSGSGLLLAAFEIWFIFA